MGDVPTLPEVRIGAEAWFNFRQDPDLASPQDRTRKVFPETLAAHVDSAQVLERDAFPKTLVLLDGYVYTWSWWLHLYNILSDFDADIQYSTAALRLHLDIGLSVTVHVRVESDPKMLAKWVMERGSQKCTKNLVVETDSFAAFVQRVAVFLEGVDEKKQHQTLKDAHVRYGGSNIGSQMFYAIRSCMPLVVGPCGATLDRLRIEFGRECFTKGYTKMYLLSRLCGKVGFAAKISTETLFEHCLQGLLFELRYDLLQVGDMTVARLKYGGRSKSTTRLQHGRTAGRLPLSMTRPRNSTAEHGSVSMQAPTWKRVVWRLALIRTGGRCRRGINSTRAPTRAPVQVHSFIRFRSGRWARSLRCLALTEQR